jgi:hypothetical protein
MRHRIVLPSENRCSLPQNCRVAIQNQVKIWHTHPFLCTPSNKIPQQVSGARHQCCYQRLNNPGNYFVLAMLLSFRVTAMELSEVHKSCTVRISVTETWHAVDTLEREKKLKGHGKDKDKLQNQHSVHLVKVSGTCFKGFGWTLGGVGRE